MTGRDGQGRVRGFALGNAVSWTTVSRDTTGALKRTIMSGRASDPTNFDPAETPGRCCGSSSGSMTRARRYRRNEVNWPLVRS
jgi:hypothetical protein